MDIRPECSDLLKYAVFQHELCPTTNRPHVQGYIEFTSPIRYGRIKQILGDPAVHLEQRKGTREQAIAYCRKEETRIDGPWEVGTRPGGQGKRTDLDNLADHLKGNPKLDSLLDNYLPMFIKYSRGISNACFLLNKRKAKTFRELDVHVYWGNAGTGKTRSAVDRDPDYYILEKTGDSLWFDGYDGEIHLIIDDFYGWIPFNQLLRLLDGYAFKCNVKGSFIYASWSKVTITSNKHPDEWYDRTKLNDNMINALNRRLHDIRLFE